MSFLGRDELLENRADNILWQFGEIAGVKIVDELSELSDRWRPYRSLAVSYLFASEYDG